MSPFARGVHAASHRIALMIEKSGNPIEFAASDMAEWERGFASGWDILDEDMTEYLDDDMRG